MASESRRKGIRLVIVLCVVVALAVTGILIWTSRRAEVKFYSEQGRIDSMSVAIGGTIEQPKDPVSKDPGYAFGGWYSDPGYVTEFDFDLPIERDTTIYVKWVERTFTTTVVRVTNTGSFNEVLWTQSGKYKSSISLPTKDTSTTYQDGVTPKYNFQRANQTFIGFSTKPNAVGDYGYSYLPGADFTVPNSNVFLYAIFRGNESSFIFNPNEGADGVVTEEKGYFNEFFVVPEPEGLSKQYYTFDYWCEDADGIPRNASGIECDKDDPDCVNIYYPGQTFKVENPDPLNLYAIWKRNQVTITIDPQGGHPDLGMNTPNYVDAGLEGGYDLSTIEQSAREGYRLMSYNTSPDGLGTTVSLTDVLTVEEDDIKLYAIWSKLLTVGYSLNNTKISDDELKKVDGYQDFVGINGDSFTVLGLPFTINIVNFTFLGWSLDESANAATIQAGNEFTLNEEEFGEKDKLILYGVWRGDVRSLQLKNTSDNQIQNISSYYGRREKITSNAIHIDSNYMFVGWGTVDSELYDYKNPQNYTGRIYKLGEYFEMGSNPASGQPNDILYSIFAPYSYNVTYYLQGGELEIAPGQSSYMKSYVYKEQITLYSSAVRAGYRFMGWSYSISSNECAFYDNGENTGFKLTMPGNSFPLYAVWSKEHTITFVNNATDSTGMVLPIEGLIVGESFLIPSESASNNAVLRPNYRIIAWSTKPTPGEGTEYSFGDSITLENSDMVTYYAIWRGDVRNVEVYDKGVKIATIPGEYGKDISLVFENEIENTDPGFEIGGFSATLQKYDNGTLKDFNYEWAYGDSIKTTGTFFQDENSNNVEVLKINIKWNRKYFTVTYELNGGTYNNDDNDDMSSYRIYAQYEDSVYLKELAPTKNRYAFQGWTEDLEDPTSPKYMEGAEFTIPSHNVVLYASWARLYTLSYSSNSGDLNEGATDLVPTQYAKGTKLPAANPPYSKTNYQFDYWNTRADGTGTSYEIGDEVEITNDLTLYAIWLGEEVELTLLAKDPGTPPAGQDLFDKQIVVSPKPRFGDSVSLTTHTMGMGAPPGLTLKGWALSEPSGLDGEVAYINDYVVDRPGAVQLFAVWSPKSYYFIIGLNGGMYNKSYQDCSLPTPYRTTINLEDYSTGPAAITKEGYKLLGFSEYPDITAPEIALNATITMPAETVRLYCVWQELTVITFDRNCDDESLPETYVFNGVAGDPLVGTVSLTEIYAMFTRPNFELEGWSTSSTATTADGAFHKSQTSYRIENTNDIYLYAVWKGRTINVMFSNNPDGGGDSSQAGPYGWEYGSVHDLTTSEFLRTNTDDGFAFGHWSTTSGENNGGGKVADNFVVTTSSEAISLITLYAIWNKRWFNLTFDYGDSTLGSNVGFDKRTVQYTSVVDVSQFITVALERPGYKFLGWAAQVGETNPDKIYGRLEGESTYVNKQFTMGNADTTLHALWEEINVPIIFSSSSPDGVIPQWTNNGAATSYTVQHLFELSFVLPNNVIDPDNGVGVYVAAYRFKGWIVKGDATNTIRQAGENFFVGVDTVIELIAQWEVNYISVVVNANGGLITEKGAGTATYSVKERDTYTFLQDPDITRGGYRLVSYTILSTSYDVNVTTSIQITTALMTAEDRDSNTVRLTANWVKQITVSFNANGKYGEVFGGTAIPNIVIDQGASITLPYCNETEGFQRQFYEFVAWDAYSDGSGTDFLAGTPYTPAGDTTLYAIWIGDERTVVLNYDTNEPGVSGEGGSIKTITGLRYGDEIDTTAYAGTCPDTGKKLDGWTTVQYTVGMPESSFNSIYLQGSRITVEGTSSGTPVNLYAVWKARSFRIVYDANGGVFYSDNTSTTKNAGEVEYESVHRVFSGDNIGTGFAVKNPDTTNTYYSFVGWSTDRNFAWANAVDNSETNTYLPTSFDFPATNKVYRSDAATLYGGFKMPANDIVLYAIWEPANFEILYFAEATDSTTAITPSPRARYNTTITLADAISKEAHNFSQWVHMDSDKTTVLGKYKAKSSLKIYHEILSEYEKTASATNKKIIFVAEWIPQTVYVQLSANGGTFDDGMETRLFESSVGRKFTLPLVSDPTNQIVQPYFALTKFNNKQNGSGAYNKLPGEEITIPQLKDIPKQDIEIGGEIVSTYVYTWYAQWEEAEAYIYKSDDERLNPYFCTLREAVVAADPGAVVKILGECIVKQEITINKTITIAPHDAYSNMNYLIKRYVDADVPANTYTGYIFNITQDNFLTMGEDTEDSLAYTMIIDGMATGSHTYSSLINVAGYLRLYNGVVLRNNRAENGAGVYVNNTAANVQIKYAKFEGNSATTSGGALYVNLASSVIIEKATFTQNSATTSGGAIFNKKILELKESFFDRNETTNDGGAVYNAAGGSVNDTSNTYSGNGARGYGGGIYNNGSYVVTTSLFTANTTRTAGGAIFNNETDAATPNMTITTCVFGNIDDAGLGNSSTVDGGAIQNKGRLSISGCNFYNNSVADAGYGGAISNDGTKSNLLLTTSVFEKNLAENGYGGALVNRNGVFNIGEEGVASSTNNFTNNSANTGRGFALAVVGGTVNIHTATFTMHKYEGTTSYGGVIFQSAGTLHINSASVNDNQIKNGYGGGLLVAGGVCNVNDIELFNNQARYGGGIALISNGTVNLKGGSVYLNQACQGGGVYLRDKNTNLNFTGGIIGSVVATSGNLAVGFTEDPPLVGNGGGIYSGGTVTVNGGVIQNNQAAGNGGGIFSNGITTLIAGSIIGNQSAYSGGGIYADNTGGNTNGTVKFLASSTVKFLVQDNLCAGGGYAMGLYDGTQGDYYGNGIYTSTNTIVSGYMYISENDSGTIINDIFIAVRDDNQDNPTKLAEFNNDQSYAFHDETRICISSATALMGDKLVKFPSAQKAKDNLSKFLFAGDEAGFRVKDKYLVLGNYAAVIMRAEEVFYSTLTEAYLDAQEGEEILVYKNIDIAADLQVYNNNSEARDKQNALVAGLASEDITTTFYVAKKVIIAAGAEYTITRGGLLGNMFTVVGNGQLILGSDSPISGANLILKGDTVESGSLIRVEAYTDDTLENPKLIIKKGVKLTGNTALKGSGIYAESTVHLLGGEIKGNTAVEEGGGIYSSAYVYVTGEANIEGNKAEKGGGIYISDGDPTVNAVFIDSETSFIKGNEAGYAGGGIYLNAGKMTIKACNIVENKAAQTNRTAPGGAGIYVGKNAVFVTTNKTTVSNDTNGATNAGYIKITHNQSGTNGGGVAVDNGTMTYPIGTITDNDAASNGGGIALLNSTAEATCTSKLDTTGTATRYFNLINSNSASNGGGIAVVAGTANISYIRMHSNTATRGGGILNKGTINFGRYTHIGDPKSVKGNTAQNDGGGIYNDTTGIINQVDGNTSSKQNLILFNNEATAGFGGGIANNGIVTFSFYTDLEGNRASAGGGMANLEDGKLTTTSFGEMYRNTATGDAYGGGGLYNVGQVDFHSSYQFGSSSTIANGNTAVRGGGVYNGGTMTVGKSDVELNIYLRINYNTAQLFGGGMYMANGEFKDYATGYTYIQQNVQEDAAGGGGGLCIAGGAFVSKVNDVSGYLAVDNNVSGGSGGGVLVTGTGDAGATFARAYGSGNSATGRGGYMAILGGDVRFADPTKGHTGRVYCGTNSSNIGSDLYLATTLTINCTLENWVYGSSKEWKGEVYLANARSYLIFNKADATTSYRPNSVNLYVKASDYTDGRRIAKFGTYLGQMELLNNSGGYDIVEYETTFAENYFTKFIKKETGIISGITYDDNGYVVFADPIAYNIERNTYHSNLAEAVSASTTESGDHILITKSHTVTNQVLIINKSIHFVIKDEIILTRSSKLFIDMFRAFNSNNAYSYDISFNPNVTLTSTAFGTVEYGKDVTLTLDGNKSHPTLLNQTLNKWGPESTYGAYQSRGSLIGISGGTYKITSGAITPDFTSAQYLLGHSMRRAGNYLNNIEYTGQSDNANVHPARFNLTCTNVDFKNNFSAFGGSAITFKAYTSATKNESSRLILTSCDFKDNETGYYSWQGENLGDHYTYYQAGAGGGALFLVGGRAEISYCNFDGNVSASHGGAIHSVLQQSHTTSPISLYNCSFTNNRARRGVGGAVSIVAVHGGDVDITGCVFKNNMSSYHGGALFLARTAKTYMDLCEEGYVHGNGHGLRPCTYTRNTVWGVYTYEFPISGISATEGWETWDTTSSKNSFNIGTGCTFEGNQNGVQQDGSFAARDGGAIYCLHYLKITDDAVVKFDGNTSQRDGGAIYTASVPYLDSESIEITNNIAKRYGGAIDFTGVVAKCENLTASNNTATHGGAFFFYKKVNLANLTITGNEATTHGGGIYFNVEDSSIKGGRIDNNSAAQYGGGIYNPGSYDNALILYHMSSMSGNKAGYRGGAIYCYGSLLIIGDNNSPMNINNNEIYSTTTDKGGGAGLWSYWEVRISGAVNFMGNEITAETPLSSGGGAAIFLYLDELWLSNSYIKSGVSIDTALKNTTDNIFFYDRGVTTYNGVQEFDGVTYTKWKGSSNANFLAVADISISGNDAGKSQGNGIYYWGSTMYISGSVKIEDDVYMMNSTSAKIKVDNTLVKQQTPYYFTYPSAPSNGSTLVHVPSYVTFTEDSASMFNITNDNYYTEKSSGTYGNYSTRSGDTLYIKMYTGSIAVRMVAASGSGETYNGMGIFQDTVGFNDSMITVYKKVVPYKEGHVFRGFEIMNGENVAFDLPFTADGSYGVFPSRSAILSAFGNVMPTELTMRCKWEANQYTLHVHKYIVDSGSLSGSHSNKEGEYAAEAGTYSYTYYITSNQTFADIITDLSETASTTDATKKKNYLLGYTVAGYMLSYDRKYYTAESKYPYTFGYNATEGMPSTDLYIAYEKATYTLTFNKDTGSEFLTEDTTMTAKYGQYLSLMPGSLIYKKGFELDGWRGSDGVLYKVPKSSIGATSYTIINDDPKYPWIVTGNKFTSGNPKKNDTNSNRRLTLVATEDTFISFKYMTSSEYYYDFLIVEHLTTGQSVGGGTQIVKQSGLTTWASASQELKKNEKLVFTYQKDRSNDSNYADEVYIKDVTCSSDQTIFTFTSDMTFTPEWKAIPYNVRVYYNYPDGGTSFKLYSVYAGSPLVDTLNESPIGNPTGYTLKGYSRSADNSTGLVETAETMPGEELILYAQWNPQTVLIQYYDENYLNILHQEEVDYGSEIKVWKTESVAIWLNIGTNALYDPESAFLVATLDTISLSFRAYNIEAAGS